MTGKAIRQEQRARLDLDFTPTKELDWKGLRNLCSILGGKGLRDWRWRTGRAEDWVCRWCGLERENRTHINTCPAWTRALGENPWLKIRKLEYQGKIQKLMEQVADFV